MRLSLEQSRAIVATTAELAGPEARVRLFGSRLDDDLRGGDIDLLVECAQPVARPVWLAAQISARLQRRLGERRIDVLVIDPTSALEPVHRVARAQGVELRP
jgi:predicted nucleotidyltransferase